MKLFYHANQLQIYRSFKVLAAGQVSFCERFERVDVVVCGGPHCQTPGDRFCKKKIGFWCSYGCTLILHAMHNFCEKERLSEYLMLEHTNLSHSTTINN